MFVAYYRVSTEIQGKSGLGLDAQMKAVGDFVPASAEVLAEFTEIESGKKSDRPELQRAILFAKSTGATLLIAKLDRLARNVDFIANLLDSGVDVLAVDMPQANKFMLHIMAAVAEQEAAMISERTKAALAAAKARGVKLGWGNPRRRMEQRMSSAKGVATNVTKADAYAEAMLPIYSKVVTSGHKSSAAIAKALNARGVPSPRGKRWYASSVSNLERRLFGLMSS